MEIKATSKIGTSIDVHKAHQITLESGLLNVAVAFTADMHLNTCASNAKSNHKA